MCCDAEMNSNAGKFLLEISLFQPGISIQAHIHKNKVVKFIPEKGSANDRSATCTNAYISMPIKKLDVNEKKK